MTKLDNKFFQDKDTLCLAKNLLWKLIVRNTRDWELSWIINEVEAYTQDDEASHTFGWKRTKRNEVMFFDAWHIYVYFTYGMYHCMNIVSEKRDYWSAVLIRSMIPFRWIENMMSNRWFKIYTESSSRLQFKNLSNWPAKLCIALWINKLYNWVDLLAKNSDIYLEDIWYETWEIKASTRIGIGKAKDKMRRFYF